MEDSVRGGSRDIGKIGEGRTFLNDERAQQAVVTDRGGRRLGIGGSVVTAPGHASDRRLGCRPAGVLVAMNVIEENEQLDGERKQRTP